MIISGEIKLAELIHHDYKLLTILQRFGISLGFGDFTINEVCKENNIDPDFFITIVKIFHNQIKVSDIDLSKINVLMLVEYLKNSHDYYINKKINYIKNQIEITFEETIQKKLLVEFFNEYSQEVKNHMYYENDTVFPYIINLVNNNHVNKEFNIKNFEDNHDNIEEKLNDLKNLIIKYYPKGKDDFHKSRILSEIFDLEDDINKHSNIEDNLLIPMVSELEKKYFL